ncbi:MAG: porphobilinogen synthase [Candidatus Hadarchaeales archaeon]
MGYPEIRMRRLRKNEKIRRLVGQVSLSADDFLYPIFVKERLNKHVEIKNMPGVYHYPLQDLDYIMEKCEKLKIPGVLVFGIPKKKDMVGSEAYSERGIVQRAVRIIKETSKLAVFTDVCLCQYTSHGHCGVLDKRGVNNDRTLRLLRKIAVSHAEAGADFVAPSGMMDGQVAAIRGALDQAGFQDVGIMSYSAKFASVFYGPFREAVESTPKPPPNLPNLKGRETYQMDFHSIEDALHEMELDLKEGADILMVKPALPYLDILREARRRFLIPLAAYQVSGEYSSIKIAAQQGLIDEKRAFLETLTAIKRAGANFIITYAALMVVKWLNEG